MLLYDQVDNRFPNATWSLLRKGDDFGIPVLDLASPPQRFFRNLDQKPSLALSNLDARRFSPQPTLAKRTSCQAENPSAEASRVIGKLASWFLICEDRQNRLEKRPVQTLAHQASLVRYVLDAPHLQKVLVGDEVGLGKTIEAGLILQELLSRNPGLRICYFAPARLVSNVCREFDQLGLSFRMWNSDRGSNADLERDTRIVASINRACHEANETKWINSDPWDILIVDECHHLSNYDPDGYSPRRQFALVQELVQRQPPTGRLILMSGTPHQGHPERFRNLLRLISEDRSDPSLGAGRVIFRTKEDVRDWHGDPLFPGRLVNPPMVMEASPEYYKWMRGIHKCYRSPGTGTAAQARAGGWRAGQALQWAASSLEAGLGYLVRTALRSGWDLRTSPSLPAALAALRPYREGRTDETVEALFIRMRSALDNVTDEDEDIPDDKWRPDPKVLAGLLDQAVGLLKDHACDKWDFLYDNLLGDEGGDQVVMFAQPIETVWALSRYLERRTGVPPSSIIGGQKPAERDASVREFWEGRSRFLVGSRAAYEGFNLQCAHRLVHIDIPWNPMDLEQRIGRVHRFGSRQTIIVDSVVTGHSREAEAYGTAYNRLREIAGALAPNEERLQLLFGRIMNLVPPDELQEILLSRAVDGLEASEKKQIANMVDLCLEDWQRFHDSYHANQSAIRALDPGAADWSDLAEFLIRQAKAEDLQGFSAEGFRRDTAGNILPTLSPARVLRLPDRTSTLTVVCEDVAGRPVSDGHGCSAIQVGLNSASVCDLLRRCAFPDAQAQIASLRLRADQRAEALAILGMAGPCLLGVAARTSLRREADNDLMEVNRRFFMWRINVDLETPLPDQAAAEILRLLPYCVVRRETADLAPFQELVSRWEDHTLLRLRAPSEEDRAAKIAHAVFPLALIHLE